MKIYHYNKETKEFTRESEARIDPLEKIKSDKTVYVIPANATVKKPPGTQAKKAICFDSETSNWKHREDHRGESHYRPDV